MLIVTPNPAVDHTVRLAELRPGEVIRTGQGISVAGGKGGNVSRAAACLGVRATVLAPVPQTGGEHLRGLYAAEDIDLVAVPIPGRVRTCTALLEDGGRVTLLNEPGAALGPGDWDRLMAALAERLALGIRAGAGPGIRRDEHPGSPGPEPATPSGARPARPAGSPEVIVCSGSLPPGAPDDGYAQIVTVGHRRGWEVVVDAVARPLELAVAAHADLVCPNLAEAEAVVFGRPLVEEVHDGGDDVPARAMAAAAAVHGRGAAWVVVTAGAAGAAVAGPGTMLWLPAPPVTVRNPIGAGDSFLAGVVTARMGGREWPAAIRRGLAAGSASVEQDRAGVLDPARVDEIERRLSE